MQQRVTEERAKWPYGEPPTIYGVGIKAFPVTDHGNGLCSQEVPDWVKEHAGWGKRPESTIAMPWGIRVKP